MIELILKWTQDIKVSCFDIGDMIYFYNIELKISTPISFDHS